jgi:hypothetical protein
LSLDGRLRRSSSTLFAWVVTSRGEASSTPQIADSARSIETQNKKICESTGPYGAVPSRRPLKYAGFRLAMLRGEKSTVARKRVGKKTPGGAVSR